MAASSAVLPSTSDESLGHNNQISLPATDQDSSGSQKYSNADCPKKQKTSSHGPEELSYRGRMVYEKGLFYPMHIGDVLVHQYLVLDKLGFGISSTVWLALDIHKNRYFALKAVSTECNNSSEEDILDHLGDYEPDHPGWQYTSQLVDTFCVPSPRGKEYGIHEFLVFNLMADTLHSLAKSFPYASIPPKIMKNFLKQILLALDHAHNAGVVHADIKTDNIMVQLPNPNAVGEKYYNVPNEPSDCSSPHQPKNSEDIILRERKNYDIDHACMQERNTWEFPSRSLRGLYLSPCPTEDEFLGLNIALCDWGLARFTDKQHIDAVAPQNLKSPEMSIGAPWNEKSDIWTLGTQLVLLMTGGDAFSAQDEDGSYSALQHLHEMQLNFGSFPRSLLDSGHSGFVDAHFNYGGRVQSRKGLVNASPLEEWFGGFDDEDDERDFINLLRHMMRIDPKERSSAAELLREPWLRDVVLDHEIPKAVKIPLESAGKIRKPADSVIDSDSERDSDSEHGSTSTRDLDSEHDSNSTLDSDSVHDLELKEEETHTGAEMDASIPPHSQSSQPRAMDADLIEPSLHLEEDGKVKLSAPVEDETMAPETTLLLIGVAVMAACPMESLVFVGLGLAIHTFCKTLKNI
ncbi:hypothetical protein BLS_002539 [Venturia inaequalis]|uniref:Protein kinase domain-containing protein n=1 Tax=Venturia inaequalis TaxID=5025 RepID=A0A8H3YVK7_VENIN|nr:hypothetical protein BLS_002539 [Venturia inaequalis]